MKRDAILVHIGIFFFDHVGIRDGYKRQRARRMDVKMGLQIIRHEARRDFSTYLYVFLR